MGLQVIPRPLAGGIAALVIVVWGLVQVADIFVQDYQPPSEIHLAVMLVLGAVYGARKDEPVKPDEPAPEPVPAAAEPGAPARESAADMIARLQRESARGHDR